MFRTGDGFGVTKIFLCGFTGTPEHPKMHKVALGAELAIPWEKHRQTWRVVERLKKEGFAVVGLEIGPKSIPIGDYNLPKKFRGKLALVVGNEIKGLSPGLQKRLDAMLEIPMVGIKESYNVAVACGIALYALIRK